ncbi:MAG: bifunctional [glutamate--ammonia ligase]-adenylyl-L-tyrosine phosphorylase/[glutamate--ammonia-ligase] adenylyltransferase [Deltaproteobacteria bacterium]|nr:bifunctional [glutamate--ammonia ligase]-adenylyl-L-tyrosine phosphorylase/[glutamate--ammonia-ligase] adenylyltransferase [Deltaproteobacteria bacterium]
MSDSLRNLVSPAQRRRLERLARRAASPETALVQLGRLLEEGGPGPLPDLAPREQRMLLQLLGGSTYLGGILIRAADAWGETFAKAIHTKAKSRARHSADFGVLAPDATPGDLHARLRRHKRREYLRIGARDLVGLAPVEETTAELSTLADFSLDTAYRFCRRDLERRHGRVRVPGTSRRNRFVILGMGKLGGQELNFSSDIDLIYLYETAEPATPRALPPLEFFSRLAEDLTRAMGEVTEDGVVFRTDLRLRPMGSQGPSAQPMDAAALYYESWGQCWERSALIKARPVAGDIELGEAFLEDVRPFVYRRYLDFSTVEELREMKARIERQQLAGGDGAQRNVKLGHGGIREVEFFTQALQLVNGGYDARIRRRNTLDALAGLARHGYVPAQECEALSAGYRFLRNVEHKIQILAHQQTHAIPDGAADERTLARRLGYLEPVDGEEQAFWRDYRVHTDVVHASFQRLFYGARRETVAHGERPGAEVWLDLDRREVVVQALGGRGFADPDKGYRDLLAVRDGSGATPPGPKRRKVMRDLMPALMEAIVASGEPQQALHHMAGFGCRIGARTGFLTLLAENPKTTRLLIDLFAHSRFLSELFVNRPELLDSLIRVDLTRVVKTRAEMLEELRTAMAEARDLEDSLDRLRRYRVEEFLRLGLHDLGGELDFDDAVAQLTALAEACLEAALALAGSEMERRHGAPEPGRFAVVAMGKLGERQLDYNSDLDLIFLYDEPEKPRTRGARSDSLSSHEYYVRLGQTLMTCLSAPTAEGIAYQLDMRLRPSGRSGPLVASLDAFRRYHETSSQLWERQALIRARFAAGDADLGAEAEDIAERFAFQDDFGRQDVREIDHLRMRMERELAREDGSRFDVKAGRGGLIDVEFLVQMLQLRFGHEHAALRQRDTLGAAAALRELRLLGARDYRILVEGYTFLRRLGHRLRIERDQDTHVLEREPGRLRAVALALGYGEKRRGSPGAALLRDYEKRRERVRACYERFFPEAD